MNTKERIEKIKEQKMSKALEDAKIKGTEVKVPLILIEQIVKKLETVEEGSEKNYSRKELDEILHSLKFDAETLGGLSVNDFSTKNHDHFQFNELLKKDVFADFRNQFIQDTGKISANIISLFADFDKLRSDDRLDKEIEKIKKQAETLKEKIAAVKHNTLANLEWSKSGHSIDKDVDFNKKRIVNLGEPKQGADAATKNYADSVAQRAASMQRQTIGGGGVHVGPTPPNSPMLNNLWVDTS